MNTISITIHRTDIVLATVHQPLGLNTFEFQNTTQGPVDQHYYNMYVTQTIHLTCLISFSKTPSVINFITVSSVVILEEVVGDQCHMRLT